MNNILFRSLVILLFAGLLGCGNNKTSGTAPAEETVEQTSSYPALPLEKMEELYSQVDYIDFVFYYTNFSMNQSDEASIKATMRHVSTETPVMDPSCQPIGSLFFQSQGQELIQAELYFTEKCVFFIWLVNGQRTYANKMTPNGFQFYQKVFQSGGGN